MEDKNLRYELFSDLIKEFALNEVKPLAKELDEEERFPAETVKKMAEAGLMGINVPTEFGGAGGDMKMYISAVEELSKVCATTGVVLSAHTSLCVTPILENGTADQKARYVAKLASGEWLGAFGLTEPNAGTDASYQQTTAQKVEGGYILNGTKIFITNAGYANVYIIFAMTDKSLGTKGITAFIVEDTFEGFKVGKKEAKMGIRGSSTCELIFTNCFVPDANVLGKIGEGFKIAMKTLDGGRIGIAAQALGIAKLLVYAAAEKKQAKSRDVSVAAAMAKLFAAEVAMEVTTKCVQLHGGYGYTRDYPVERMMRDAKITEIYEGTSEVQRMVISGALLR